MMKICVALLLISTCLLELQVSEASRRRAKMSRVWRTQTRRKQGYGSYSVRGTAGGESPQTAIQSAPTIPRCTERGFYPYPDSCIRFYRCVDFIGDGTFFQTFLFTCPVGTVFDDRIDVCNHPWAAGRPECFEGAVASPVQITQPDQSGKETEQPDSADEGVVPDPVDKVEEEEPASDGKFSLTCYEDNIYRVHPLYCNQYYICTFESIFKVVTLTCPPDLIFDGPSQSCIREASPIGSGCNRAPASEPKPSGFGEQPPIVAGQEGEGTDTSQTDSSGLFSLECNADNKYKQHPMYCNQYYYCILDSDGTWQVPILTCPPRLLFDQDSQRCLQGEAGPDCDLAPYDTPRPSITDDTDTSGVQPSVGGQTQPAETQPSGQVGTPEDTGTGDSETPVDGSTPVDPAESEPATDTGSQPATDTGSQPATDTGSQPSVGTDSAQPAAGTGSQPATDTGSQPATDTGSQPATDTGSQPATDTGSQPSAGTVSEPAAGTDSQPPSGPISFKCYADNKYRIHPLYCNQYYYCIADSSGVWEVPILTCPPDLIFDEDSQTCIREVEGMSSTCERAPSATAQEISQIGTSDPDTEAEDGTASPAETDQGGTQTTAGAFSLTCYADNKYRIHPMYCNQYYYCISDDGTWKVPILTCPPNLLFDEENQRCAAEVQQTSSDCALAPYDTPQPDSEGAGTDGSGDGTDDQTSSGGQTDQTDQDATTPETETGDQTGSSDGSDSSGSESPSGAYSITCYADNRYRQHPMYCNQYFYCIFGGTWHVPIFTCPPSLVFEEESQSCVREVDQTNSTCQYAPSYPALPSSDLDSGTFVNAEGLIRSHWEIDRYSKYDCPAPGYYPFEGACNKFYRCVETERSQLRGLRYSCPANHDFSEKEVKCLHKSTLDPCERVLQDEHVETATPLYTDDLNWFFNN